MYLRKLLRNSLGMSLTEVVVGVGLLGGVSVVTMKIMQEQSANEAYLKYTAAVNNATAQVMNALNNDQRCKEMLVGQNRDANPWPSNTSYLSIPLRISAGGGQWKVLLAPDTEYAEGFYIPANGIQLAPLGSSTNQMSELIITFKTRNRALWKNNNAQIKNMTAANQGTIVKRIPFITEWQTVSGNQQIKACGKVVSDNDLTAKRTMCIALAGAADWDDTTGTCTIKEMKCPSADMVPTTMTSLGGVVCKKITDANFRNQLFDFTSSNCAAGQSVTLGVGSMGKIKATCVGTALGCASSKMVWTQGVNSCSGTISGVLFGVPSTVTDTSADSTPTITGSATYLCNSATRTWTLQGTPTCTNSAINCPAQTVTWSGATKFCTYTTTVSYSHGQSQIQLDDVTNGGGSDGTGRAHVECVNGKLSINANRNVTPNTPYCN